MEQTPLRTSVHMIIILISLIVNMIYENYQYKYLDKQVNQIELKINERFSDVEKDVAIIKAVMMVKNIKLHKPKNSEKE